jgi:hypothetical protein
VADDRFQAPDLATQHALSEGRERKVSPPLVIITGSLL